MRFDRDSDGDIHDIYDGSEYKKHVHRGFLSSVSNVSLLMNTDGVQVFSSSKREVWPIWLAINELPPNLRFKMCDLLLLAPIIVDLINLFRFSKQHMLLAGLWFDSQKPTMATFLHPLMNSLNDLYVKGMRTFCTSKIWSTGHLMCV